MAFKFSMGMKQVDYNYFMPNVGCMMDILTSSPVKGVHGQTIINGGHNGAIGVTGPGNSFKSVIADHINQIAAFRTHRECTGGKYDTETNVAIPGLIKRLKRIIYPFAPDWYESGKWEITDSSIYFLEEWFTLFKKFMASKVEARKEATLLTPILDRENKPLKVIIPTFMALDSLSKAETKKIDGVRNSSDIGDSKQNMIQAHSNLYKKNMVDELGNWLRKSNTYMTLTMHFGEALQFDIYKPIHKPLSELDTGTKIKGVPSNIYYLTSIIWLVKGVSNLHRPGDKNTMEYPIKGYNNQNVEDLKLIRIKPLRNKTGPSGGMSDLVVSQSQGVLESLTQFHYLRVSGGFGLIGSSVSGSLNDVRCVLLPDVKMTRTTVRSMLDENYKLSQAIRICADLHQMQLHWEEHLLAINPKANKLKPEELYQMIKDRGYDWDMLLNTRSWVTLDDGFHETLELNTYDIVRMAYGDYHPFWLENDKRTIKKKYQAYIDEARKLREGLSAKTTSLLEDMEN